MRRLLKLFAEPAPDEPSLEPRLVPLFLLAGVVGVIWRVPAMLGLFCIGMIVLLLARVSRNLLLREARYVRDFSTRRLSVGETFTVMRTTINGSRLPTSRIQVMDTAPRAFTLLAQADAEADLPALAWLTEKGKRGPDLSQWVALLPRERVSKSALLRANQRGYYRFPDATLRITDALGIGDAERAAGTQDDVIVYPRLIDLTGPHLPNRELYGALHALRTLVEDPLRVIGARDYAWGDDFRWVDWKASARRGKLQTRVHERASEPCLALLLDVSTYEREWEGIAVESFEKAVSVAASLAHWADEQGWPFGLSSNGNAPSLPHNLRVRARRSPRQFMRVMENLAAITAYPILPCGLFLFSEQRHLPTTSVQVVITPLPNPALVDAVTRLAASGKRLIVLTIDCPAPVIDGVPAFRLDV